MIGNFRQVTDLVRYIWVFYIVGFNAERQDRFLYAPIRSLIAQAIDGFAMIGEALRGLLHFPSVESFFSLKGFVVSFGALLLLAGLIRLGVGLARWLRRLTRGGRAGQSSQAVGNLFFRRLLQLLEPAGVTRPVAETPREFARRAADVPGRPRRGGRGRRRRPAAHRRCVLPDPVRQPRPHRSRPPPPRRAARCPRRTPQTHPDLTRRGWESGSPEEPTLDDRRVEPRNLVAIGPPERLGRLRRAVNPDRHVDQSLPLLDHRGRGARQWRPGRSRNRRRRRRCRRLRRDDSRETRPTGRRPRCRSGRDQHRGWRRRVDRFERRDRGRWWSRREGRGGGPSRAGRDDRREGLARRGIRALPRGRGRSDREGGTIGFAGFVEDHGEGEHDQDAEETSRPGMFVHPGRLRRRLMWQNSVYRFNRHNPRFA